MPVPQGLAPETNNEIEALIEMVASALENRATLTPQQNYDISLELRKRAEKLADMPNERPHWKENIDTLLMEIDLLIIKCARATLFERLASKGLSEKTSTEVLEN